MLNLRPSSSNIWTECAAMPRFSADLPPEEESDAAREGTCAAWAAEQVLTGAVEDAAALVGESHENGWLIERDMAYYVQGYVNHVRSHGGTIYAENRVYLNPMINGTPDAFAVTTDSGVLRVDDLKYGFGIVNPYRNTQVSIYAGAILRSLNADIERVVIGIYQPRAFHPEGIYRTWEVTVDELMEFVAWIEQCGSACQSPDAEATPGTHCEYCPAASVCVALAHSVYRGYDVLTSRDKANMSGEEMSKELEFLDMMEKLLKARKSAITTEATARIKNADHIPGWHLQDRFGNRKFDVDADAVKLLTGIDPYEQKLCTPAELIRRGADEETVNRMSSRPRIKPKLEKRADDYFDRIFKTRKEG